MVERGESKSINPPFIFGNYWAEEIQLELVGFVCFSNRPPGGQGLGKPKLKLTKKIEQRIKATVKELLEKLKEQKFVLDWKKKTRTRADVQVTIEDILWKSLPEPPYTSEIKKEKCYLLYQHVYDSYYGASQSVYT